MTLYLWMHWFWITCCINACYSVDDSMHSASVDLPSIPEVTKNTTESANIPPIEYSTTTAPFIPVKSYKSIKKHFSVTKVGATVKETAVIDRNSTESSDNDRAVLNSNFSTENVSIESDDYTANRSRIVQFGDEESERANLSAAGITGITLGCISIIGAICAASFIVYRNYGINRPQVLNDRCSNPDSSVYIDDTTIRENSEEMYSLDNDSFLNSLEAMTIQNLWTDTVKHTKL